MSVGRVVDAPCAASSASAQPGHVGFCAGFVQKDETVEGKRGLRFAPTFARLGDIGPQLLARTYRFFL